MGRRSQIHRSAQNTPPPELPTPTPISPQPSGGLPRNLNPSLGNGHPSIACAIGAGPPSLPRSFLPQTPMNRCKILPAHSVIPASCPSNHDGHFFLYIPVKVLIPTINFWIAVRTADRAISGPKKQNFSSERT